MTNPAFRQIILFNECIGRGLHRASMTERLNQPATQGSFASAQSTFEKYQATAHQY